jgi:signal transduction histidine kinase/ligand-binding sensor domain-containing protein
MAQDRDGYLWLGCVSGLHRFDGMRFIAWKDLSSAPIHEGLVQALHAGSDGSLWVGFADRGGITSIRGLAARNYGTTDGLPAAAVITIVEDAARTIWVGTDAGLFSLDGDRWIKWPSGRGLPDGTVWAAHVDRQGTFYVANPQGLFRRSAGGAGFEKVTALGDAPSPAPTGVASRLGFKPDTLTRSIVSDAGGEVFLSDYTFGFRPVGAGVRQGAHHGRGLQLLVDRSGRLWVATSGQGVWRIDRPQRSSIQAIERLTQLTGLAAEGAFSLLEDRGGNVWAGGTPNGLTRMTPQRFIPLRYETLVRAVAATPDGHLWLGTSDGLIELLDPDGRRDLERRLLAGSSIHALHVDAGGTLWAATPKEIVRIGPHGGAVTRIGVGDQVRQFDSITSDGQGALLLADAERGLLRWDGHSGFDRVQVVARFDGRRIVAVHADGGGRIWTAFAGSGMAVVGRGDVVRPLTAQDGFDAGEYRVMYEDHEGVIWFGGARGITRWEHGRGVTIRATNPVPIQGVRAITEDQFDSMWIGTSAGVVRVARDTLRDASILSASPRVTLYDKTDGLAGVPAWLSDRTTARTAGGALWFVTGEGLSIVQPTAPASTQPAPPSSIVSVTTEEDRGVAPLAGIRLPAGTRRLRIEYSALNLTSPQKTRFRYRLDGIDSGWVEGGSRRQASYANLGPGPYRFLLAASDLGTWDGPITEWSFSIQPHVYQTWWFAGAVAALLVLAGWGAWTARLRRERARFALVLAERARLSREIHDTLLQGLVGVGMQCDALARDLERTAPETQERFVRLRKQTKRYIKEARQAIWHLRSSHHEREALVDSLQRLGDQIASPKVEFSFSVKGTVRPLDRNVEQQILRIAHEAVTNAVLHARGMNVHVGLEYQPTALRLHVADDGCGFAEPPGEGVNGHYGIISMRERAEAVNGRFHLASEAQRGTRIEVTVPLDDVRSGIDAV